MINMGDGAPFQRRLFDGGIFVVYNNKQSKRSQGGKMKREGLQYKMIGWKPGQF